MPELGFGSDVSASGVHVRPPSADQVSKIRCDRVRPTACSLPPGWTRMLGWIASMAFPPDAAGGDTDVHVTPPSAERSKCTRHTLGRSVDSVLLPASRVPSGSSTGLFLTGPRMPSGSRRASLHVRPPSPDVRAMPHHVCGLGPTL